MTINLQASEVVPVIKRYNESIRGISLRMEVYNNRMRYLKPRIERAWQEHVDLISSGEITEDDVQTMSETLNDFFEAYGDFCQLNLDASNIHGSMFKDISSLLKSGAID